MRYPQVAARLRECVEGLADEVVRNVWEHLPGYDPAHMSRRELERFVAPHLLVVLDALAEGRRPSGDELARAMELGRTRALEGVPVESMMQSWRTAERVLLDALLSFSEKLGTDEVRAASKALHAVLDELIDACVVSYRRAQDEVTIHYEQIASDMVARLSSGAPIDPEELAEQARLVGADHEVGYQAVALALPAASKPQAIGHVHRHVLASLGPVVNGRILTGVQPGRVLLLVPEPQAVDIVQALQRAVRRPELREDALVGIGRAVDGLANSATSCAEAAAAVEVAALTGRSKAVTPYERVIPEILLSHNRHTVVDLVRSRLGPLLDRPDLLETLRAYLRHGLSLNRTAEALVVHPNTVTYRLNRITGLLDRKLDDMLDALDIAMSLRALEFMGSRLVDEGAIDAEAANTIA